ncbi:hypothetical protein [Lacticaseibacillus nasuensis]|uniref:hypothetical protein n=1 Tax=Lacticaseibacillus nasuensis TaxID=944671 RepID=UPI0022470F2B|nr:hypothetical protein [Lacticaseibacillus nasuensis]MCX2454490.1 hypothetical protein [Lacticaseibacillus nasuensis]
MKVAFDHFQAHLMDIIISSLLALLGVMTIIGTGTGVVAAMMYWRHANGPQWRAFFKPRQVGRTVLVTISGLVGYEVIWFDLRLAARLTIAWRLGIFAITIAVGYVGACIILQALWQLAAGRSIDLNVAFYLSFAWLPKWIGIGFGMLVGGVAIWLWPATCVVVAGLEAWWLNRQLSQGYARIAQ